jgi:drug/metabolite transporter (DMT)-like permease
LVTALCETGRDLVTRDLLRRSGWSSRRVMGLNALVSGLLTLPLLVLHPSSPDLPALLLALAVGGLLNAVAFWAYGRALARGDLSLVLPLINLSPLVLLLSGWLLLGERPSAAAAGGVILLVLGALLLGRGVSPGARLITSPGARPMLLVALLWGVAAAFDKLGVRAGGSLLWVVLFNLTVAAPLLLPLPAPWRSSAVQPSARPGKPPWPAALVALFLIGGALGAVGMIAHMEALRFTAVVHVIAIKRLSTLWSALAGVAWLGEPRGSLRLPAAALMLAGAVVVLAAGR